VLLNCLMYKLCYYRFGELKLDHRAPSGYDRTRNAEIGNKNIKLTHLEEAYTTEHWLVRIYRVKDMKSRESSNKKPRLTSVKKSKKYNSKKSRYNKAGHLKNKVTIKKGKQPKNVPTKKSTKKKTKTA